ncbi:serine hydrolase domain-containing protein [Herbiconiux ginsengi]|uniref:CubicO group peptidase, beta-lactamase class C family n=1 Tax=Herbiconiux ginsengi TaxID=381665 RepID=A0A1H3JTA3_9MICO|nr:serine hydrolase domain-containing protein [Herbiconiux ginsengi]SDY42504.1 CubicO group peptidase, beta-lactamase class C family [Herbiconiux ginsengi]
MDEIAALLDEATGGDSPTCSAAVVLVSSGRRIVVSEARGTLARVADERGAPHELATVPTSVDTLFDLASITKLFTAAALLTVLDEQGSGPDLPVAEALAEYRHGDLSTVTAAHLLSHTAGWPAEWTDRRTGPTAWSHFRSALPSDPPGRVHRYSCVGYLWAGLLAENLSGESLDTVVSRTVLEPLGLRDTMFTPGPELRGRIAATEYQRVPDRGLVHGVVHDETAWALGGVTGNAGLFGSASDLLVFADMLRNGGRHEGRQALPAAVVTRMTTDQLAPLGLLPARRPAYGQALGPRIGEAEWMGPFAERGAIGHTGFTGTSLIVEPGGDRSIVFLTNRVHPTRHRSDIRQLRLRVADAVVRLEE